MSDPGQFSFLQLAQCSLTAFLRLSLAATLFLLPLAAVEKHPTDNQSYELHPALEMTLFAVEPEVVDPVAMTFDEEGRVYVVEMRDYPLGIGPEHRPGGTIRLLEDRDSDGKIDHSTIFADGLSFPTSVAPWNGGILVTAPPEIIFLKDTDGDGKADLREVVLRGFRLGVTDSNVNGLRWGLDNRVHGANGGNGGSITSPRRPGPPMAIRNLDFSFDPATGDFTPTYQTGAGFGLVFDEWGRSFVTYNINHIQHRVLPVRYLERFPGLPPVETTVSISDHEEASRIYPISIPETRVNHPEQAGHFSAAGGMGWIGPAGYEDLLGSILVCDVVGNLVHRDVLVENGPSFTARRSVEDARQEFFASRDNSFRPVGVETGPDGALYLIDMQRDVIEHPDYIPQKVKEKSNLRAGEDRGRIYRITPKGGLPFRKPALRRASTESLVNELSNPNPWWRLTAQRLLVERQDRAAVPRLKAIAASGKEPLGRLHALWSLQGLNALEVTTLRQALSDEHVGIRENALILAEGFATGSAELQQKILILVSDPSPRVRFQTALTIGEFQHPRRHTALLEILRHDYRNRWTRLAVLSSLSSGADKIFALLLEDERFGQAYKDGAAATIRELADLIGARLEREPAIDTVLNSLADTRLAESLRIAGLEGLNDGMARASVKSLPAAKVAESLQKMAQAASPSITAAAWKISRGLGLPEAEWQRAALAEAMTNARNTALPPAARVERVRLLALGDFSTVSPVLVALIQSLEPASVQLAAIEGLRSFGQAEVAKNLIAGWRQLAPAARPLVIQLLLQRQAFHEFLIAAIENGQIKLGELNLDLEQRRRLLRNSSPAVKGRAQKLFGDEEYSNRKTVVDEWLKKLPPAGDVQRGRAVFEKICAQCHAVSGQGHQVGPDLTDVYHRSLEDLVSNILDPNMAINPSYLSYNVELTSGESEVGILKGESADSITLLQALGRQVVVPRKNIKRLESSGLSLMPEGLEAGLTPADLRDLIAFLQEKR